MGAGRVADTQVALNHQIVIAVEQRTAKGTGRNTRHAADTLLLIEVHRAGFSVARDGVDQTGLRTGGIVALQTGNRHPSIGSAAREGVDAAAARLAVYTVGERAGQLAGAAAGAEDRIDVETRFHTFS